MTIDVLLLGGRGRIGSGLRMYLPRLDPAYRFTCVDLPGCEDQAGPLPQRDFIDLDIAAEPGRVRELMAGRDLVVYLARQGSLTEMNAMTDQVFKAVLAQDPVPMVIGASSVHACDGAYSVDEGSWSIWAERRFDGWTRLRSVSPASSTPARPTTTAARKPTWSNGANGWPPSATAPWPPGGAASTRPTP